MIYEFKSRATGSVIMTKDVAEAILQIIGKAAASQGIIVPDSMAGAIAALEAASANNKVGGDDDEGKPVISLGQRAFPLIEMLKAAKAAGKEITWGV